MTMGKMRRTLHQRPFRAFLIHLADGRTILVSHPDFVSAEEDGRIIEVTLPDGTEHIIDLYLIIDLEILPPKAPAHETN